MMSFVILTIIILVLIVAIINIKSDSNKYTTMIAAMTTELEATKKQKEEYANKVNELVSKITILNKENLIATQKAIKEARRDASKRASSITKGKISEQFIPFMPGFKYNPSDCIFIGQPIDFLIMDGLSEGKVKEIIIYEAKTGKANLSSIERSIKDAVNSNKFKYVLGRIDKDNKVTESKIRTNKRRSSKEENNNETANS